MANKISSFSVGISTKQQKFNAVVIKFKFSDGTELLTAWAREAVKELLRIALVYSTHLKSRNVAADPDALEATMKSAPPTTLEDIEGLLSSTYVVDVSGTVNPSNDLQLVITRAKAPAQDDLVLSPSHCEWLISYIGHALKPFDDGGSFMQ